MKTGELPSKATPENYTFVLFTATRQMDNVPKVTKTTEKENPYSIKLGVCFHSNLSRFAIKYSLKE